MQIPSRTHLEVDLDVLAHNARALRDLAGESDVMAVLKADAYGHGAVMVAREYTLAGICRFAVATLAEALDLRHHRVPGELLILGYTDPVYAVDLITREITQTVVGVAHAEALSEAAVRAGGELCVHIKIDTGMSRVGLDANADSVIDDLRIITGLPGLRVTGCFTHFASADIGDEASDDFTRHQTALFKQVTDAAKAAGIALGMLHACNSSGALRFKEAYFDMIRPGSLVEGLDPMPKEYNTQMAMKPAVNLRTVVALVKEVPAGRSVGYARSYYTKAPMVIATLAIGYADGYPRALSNKGRVLINGRYAPVVGRVCMDQTMVDVTDIPGVKAGDTATLIGTDGGETLSLSEIGEATGAIYVEILARLGRRVPVVYLRDGGVVAVLDYMAGGLAMAKD